MYNFRNPFYNASTFTNRKYYSNYNNYNTQSKFQNSFNNNAYQNHLYNYTNNHNNNCISTPPYEKKTESIPPHTSDNNSSDEHSTRVMRDESNNKELFEIFGLKIYFDDLLILCILIFLYQEGVKDEYLFISLILLLLN